MSAAYDAVVVGGGPAGAITAYELAKRSLRVALIEKQRVPRYKTCAGAVAPHVAKLLDFSLEPVIERITDQMRITVNGRRPFVREGERPFAWMVMRDRFDAYLLEQAVRVGVEVHQEAPLVGLATGTDGYVARTPQRELSCRYLVGADGANGSTRRLLGAPRFQRTAVALEWEIAGSPESLDAWRDTVAIDLGSVESGYGWVFPKAANFSLGVMTPRALGKQLKTYCARTRELYRDAIGDAEPHVALGHHLPIRVPDEPLVFGRALLVGDAAGLIDAVVGEGIYYAIQSGQFAAEAITRAIATGDAAELVRYQQRVDAEIQPELQASKAFLYLLDLAPRFTVPFLLRPWRRFWRYFFGIFGGERRFREVPDRLGPLAGAFHATFARDDRPLYSG
ncbi:MAG TPA: geranylgeranyl reductase family protein [Thermoanaerobaculia bacterium]|nr:geranylgeranyl reductase family protein [Thermoanaerobaculia bacterium]